MSFNNKHIWSKNRHKNIYLSRYKKKISSSKYGKNNNKHIWNKNIHKQTCI